MKATYQHCWLWFLVAILMVPIACSGNTMMAVSVQTETRFFAGTPTALFEGSYRGLNSTPRGYQYYDISPDGQRFLMVKLGEDTPQIHVVLNWFEELKRLVPTN